MMRVALYARVSSKSPEREGSIDSQVAALDEFAGQKGYAYKSSDVYLDPGYSGQTFARPGLDALRDAVWEGRYDCILIYAPDRLARHYAHQYLLLEEFRKNGCEVKFVHHAYGDSPEEQMLLQLQGIFGQYEHAKICERIRRGRLHQVQVGRAHYSRPPYGYIYVPKHNGVPGRIEVHPEEADLVCQIYHWFLEEELNTYQIASRLNALKIPTKRGCGFWHQSVAVNILTNPVYMGTGYFHRYQLVLPTYSQRFEKRRKPHAFRLRAKDEWVAVEVPAIISAEMFRRAQEKLKRNRLFSQRNSHRPYLLRGLLQCKLCGYRLSGRSQRSRRYYGCTGSKPTTRGEQNCPQRYVPAETLEELVWQNVAALLWQPELILQHYHQLHHQAKESSLEYQEQQRIRRQVERLHQQKQRVVDAYQNGVIDLNELQQRKERIEEREQFLNQLLKDVDRRLEEVGRQVDLREGIEAFASRIQRALENPPFEDRQRILRLVIDRIEVGEEEIVIKHAIPIPMCQLKTHDLRPTYCLMKCVLLV